MSLAAAPSRPATGSTPAGAGSARPRRQDAATGQLGALLALLALAVWGLAFCGGCVTGAQVCTAVQSAGLGRPGPDPYQTPAVATASVCVDLAPPRRPGG